MPARLIPHLPSEFCACAACTVPAVSFRACPAGSAHALIVPAHAQRVPCLHVSFRAFPAGSAPNTSCSAHAFRCEVNWILNFSLRGGGGRWVGWGTTEKGVEFYSRSASRIFPPRDFFMMQIPVMLNNWLSMRKRTFATTARRWTFRCRTFRGRTFCRCTHFSAQFSLCMMFLWICI